MHACLVQGIQDAYERHASAIAELLPHLITHVKSSAEVAARACFQSPQASQPAHHVCNMRACCHMDLERTSCLLPAKLVQPWQKHLRVS
jgi:hypothetical protein